MSVAESLEWPKISEALLKVRVWGFFLGQPEHLCGQNYD